MKKPTILYFVRHGETVWNVQKRIQGHKDIRLNREGREQAHTTAQKLFSEITHVHAIISSDLQRTAQTAEIIAEYFNTPVTFTTRLRERDFGSFSGKSYKQISTLLKDAYKVFDGLSEEDKFDFSLHPEIESERKLRTRVMSCIEDTVNTYSGKTVVIVTHGGVLRSILTAMQLLTTHDHGRIHIGNGAYFAIRFESGTYFLALSEGVTFPK
ncbi:MAG: histidine phosphatase family protein [Candidatus Roizmanbacteria bacterium]|nr:histidine phosphatase family protein [Candidatus Roizmanbacteria bacterium]